jgi:signal peptidase
MSRGTHAAGLSLASPRGRREVRLPDVAALIPAQRPAPALPFCVDQHAATGAPDLHRTGEEAGAAAAVAPIRPFTDFAFVPQLRVRRSSPSERSVVRTALRPVGLVAQVAGNLVLVAAILGLLLIAVGPRTGHYRTLTMLTGSMTPLAPPGSVVVVTPQRPEELRVGQVITFNAPTDGRVVTHRITRITEDDAGYVVRTKGDANGGEDDWNARIAHGQTVWRMRAAVPGLGYAISSLRQPRMQTTMRLVLPAVLLLTLIMSIWRPKQEDE